MPARAKPIHLARAGAVRVSVMRDGPGRCRIDWRRVEGGPLVRERFRGPHARAAAIQRADEIARAIHNGQSDVLTLSGADRDQYRHARLLLDPLGIPLVAAVEEYAAVRALLPEGMTLRGAVEAAVARAAAARGRRCPPAAEVVAALLAARAADRPPAADPREDARVQTRLAAFAAAFPDLTALVPASPVGLAAAEQAAKEWLRALRTPAGAPVAAKTRDHYLDAAKRVLAYAQRRAWLPQGEPHAFSGLRRAFKPGDVETFSLAELREILRVCPPEWLPFAALGAFAGLRTAEIGRLAWDAVRWDEGEIVLDRRITKTNTPRNVTIEPNLRAWLAPHARRVGRLFPGYASEGAFENGTVRLHRTIEDALHGFKWRANALRHSFGSYHYGRGRNLALTRAQMGNTEPMMMRYYNSPKTVAEGTAWFELAPASAANITPIPLAG
jgi:integrase